MFQYLVRILKTIVNSSLNVVLASCICCIAFYKLPFGNSIVNYSTILLLGCISWTIYIFDRMIDNQSINHFKSERHEFHKKNQFVLQSIVLGLILVSFSLVIFQKRNVLLLGFFISCLVVLYFLIINKNTKGKYFKEILMPIIYCLAIVGIPFVEKSSINLSEWILAFIFFNLIFQNILFFSIKEYSEEVNMENICSIIRPVKIRRTINYLGAINIFLVIFFFSGQSDYTQKLAWVFLLVSISISIILSLPSKYFKNENYRWIVDGLLFLPLFIF